MITPDFLLTPQQLDVLWSDLGLHHLPYPLDVPSVGRTREERLRIREEVYAELQRNDLAHNGRMDAELEGLLRLLDDHAVSVDAVAHVQRSIRALAASDGKRAVLAVVDDGKVGLLEIRPTSLAWSITQVLPDGNAGPGHSISMRAETLEKAVEFQKNPPEADEDDPWGDDEMDEREALMKAGLSSDDATFVSELATGRVAGGQFGVSRGGGGGVRSERAKVLITWFDTSQGRYIMVNDGEWLSLAPTDNDRIANRIGTLLEAVPA
ncbi:ESX secretion-associated protein EspG [Umezawaea beigongshangensis]|uniref:ESX secretion-associated protein EspG n=1 Tax=Umezawaea beigongshangensis TaxID=2780383 RepID=UPI0018F17790|nr:ESX secretion-associated protein EspG [Umezawaea beigongshangensis]